MLLEDVFQLVQIQPILMQEHEPKSSERTEVREGF